MKYTKHPGRHGDKRMNRALEARKKDPDLSLLAALLAGGFIFPQLYSVKMAGVLDVDGVSVYQRKRINSIGGYGKTRRRIRRLRLRLC